MSVIMPVYNGAKFLRESIESILNQSYKDFEFIIINDGSTDESRKIIEEFATYDDRIKFINRSDNKRIVYTLNEGILASKGKYIARMDVDDIAHKDRFTAQVAYLDEHPEIFVLGTSYIVFENNNPKKTVSYNYPSIYMAFKFLSNTYLCHPSVMFRKKAIEHLGNYNETEAEDFELFSRIIKKYKCTNLAEPYLLYREHENNRSFEHANKIKKSVYKIYENNYNHYVNDGSYCSKFYKFHTCMRGSIIDMPKYIYYSLKIQNRIRRSYNVSWLDYEFHRSIILFQKEMVIKCYKRFKNLLKKF